MCGIVSDPFGSSICLILVGLFFARKRYRMNLLTITDYYRKCYDRKVEVITGIAIIISIWALRFGCPWKSGYRKAKRRCRRSSRASWRV